MDAMDAIAYYNGNPNITDAEKAYVVAVMHNDKYTNKMIRKALSIKAVYTVTHLLRVGTRLTEPELVLWHKNASRITMGHVRAIAKLPYEKRDGMLRALLTKRIPVSQFEAVARGGVDDRNTDIKRYETLMSEVVGRPINIKFNKVSGNGKITLDFYGLDDLDELSRAIGFRSEDYI